MKFAKCPGTVTAPACGMLPIDPGGPGWGTEEQIAESMPKIATAHAARAAGPKRTDALPMVCLFDKPCAAAIKPNPPLFFPFEGHRGHTEDSFRGRLAVRGTLNF